MLRPWVLTVGCSLAAVNAQSERRCQELCKYDEGGDGNMQQCLTECATYMDIAPPHEKQDAVKQFVDGDQGEDNVASDRDRDDSVSSAEFRSNGEDNVAEESIDKMAEPATQGGDEYAEASVPSFDRWDYNQDGYLQRGELFDAFMHEMKRRDVADFGTSTAGTGNQDGQLKTWSAIFEKIFPSIDHNNDGKISRVEFNNDAMESDFGGELREGARADEYADDPDDARRPVTTAVPDAAPPSEPLEAPASMLRSGRRHRSKRRKAGAERLSTSEIGDASPHPTLEDTPEARKKRAEAAARFEAMLGRAADQAVHHRQARGSSQRRIQQND